MQIYLLHLVFDWLWSKYLQYYCQVYYQLLRLQSWTKGWRQILEIKQNRFFYGMFYNWFFAIFYRKTSEFGFSVDGWKLAIKPKHFRDFLEISWIPKILSLKSFGNSWGISYIHFLVIKICCVSLLVRRNCAKKWKSLQMFFTRL